MTICSICSSKYLAAIEAALASGESKSAVGRRHGVSRHAIKRHVEHSIEGVIVQASRPELEGKLHDLDGRLVALEAVLQRTLDDALATGKATVVTAVSSEIRKTLESLAKLRGQLDERPVVNLAVVPEFRAMTSRLLDALLPYPEARLAAAEALAHAPTGASARSVEEPEPKSNENADKDEADDGLGASPLSERLERSPGDSSEPRQDDTRQEDENQENRNGGELVLLREVPGPSTEDPQGVHEYEDGPR